MTGNERPAPLRRAISVTAEATSASDMPGRTIRIMAWCISTEMSTASSIWSISAGLLWFLMLTTDLTNGIDACSV